MQNKIFSFHFSFFIYIFALCISSNTFAQDTVFVDNTEQFISSVKSNRVIIITSEHIKLPDEELLIENIQHLTIIGGSKKQNKISTSNAYNTVMIFKKSKNIKIKNLCIGHWPDPGYCTGDVLSFSECDSIFIHKSDFYGSGLHGLNISRSNIWCYNTMIRDCSENIINLNTNRSSIHFYNCKFYLNRNNIMEYFSPRFENCDFYDYEKKIIEKEFYGYYPDSPLIIKADSQTGNNSWELFDSDGELENVCPNTIKIVQTNNHNDSLNMNSYYGYKNGDKIKIEIKSIVADYETWGLSGEFKIMNGFTENENEWKAHSRIKQFKVFRNNKVVALIDLQDTPNIQTFHFGEIVRKNNFSIGEVLEFEITEIYKGEKFNTTAISYFSACCSP